MALAWRRTARFGHPEVFAAIGGLSFLAARFLPLLTVPFTCPFRAATSLPCASCGMTHAFVLLARGELGAALAASPLGALLAGAVWAYALLDLVRWGFSLPWPEISPRSVRSLAALAALAVLANWAYLIAATRG
jgi:hypothetical protein